MNHWLDRGADGWRLDAAYATPRHFWAEILPQVRNRHPDAYIFGEIIHGNYTEFVRQTGVDAVTQYELWKAIWSALRDRNLFELAWALDRHNRLLDDFVPLTFVGNHDVTRLATQIGDDRHIPHALAILLTCGGTPSIYAGDEQAFHATKENRAGGDDAIRPAFPVNPGDLPSAGWPTYRLHQNLIGLRRRNAWLRSARTKIIQLTNTSMTLQTGDGERHLLVALNLDDTACVQPAPAMRRVLAGHGTLHRPGDSDARIQLAPHGWAILSANPG
jgi:cyclomaltodextrinase